MSRLRALADHRLLPWAAAALALLWLAVKLLGGGSSGDFKYVWLAGELWSEGLSPYTDVFETRGEEMFTDGSRPRFWAYPPNWYLPAQALALPGFEAAAMLWRVLNIAFLAAGAALILRALPAPAWRQALFLLLTAVMTATGTTLYLGQTSALMFLGIALYVFALARGGTAAMILGLVILGLKPTVGLVLALFLLPSRRWWPAMIAAAAITAALALPPVLLHGWSETLSGIASRLEGYASLGPNLPRNVTGLRAFLLHLTDVDIPTWVTMVVPGALALGLGALVARQATLRPERIALPLALLALVQLHGYDLIYLSVFVLLYPGWRVWDALALVFAVLIMHPTRLAETLGLVPDGATLAKGSFFVTGVMIALLVLLLALAATRRQAR